MSIRTIVERVILVSGRQLAASLVGIVVAVASIGSLVSLVGQRQQQSAFTDLGYVTLAANVASLQARVQQVTSQIESLSATLNSASKSELENAGLSAQLKQLESVTRDVNEIKQVILNDPAKALTLPLMRKDMTDLAQRQADLAAATNVEIDRIYDFSKWFLALMITLSVGLVTMGFIRVPTKNG